MKTGSWQTPRLTGGDVTLVVASLVIPGFIRAWDYSTGDDNPAVLSLVEDAFPLYVWGAILVVLCTTLCIGLIFKYHFLVWVSHSLSALIYFALFVGISLQVLDLDYPYDGIRWIGVLITPLIIHSILAVRTGPKPLSEGHIIISEAVVKEDG